MFNIQEYLMYNASNTCVYSIIKAHYDNNVYAVFTK